MNPKKSLQNNKLIGSDGRLNNQGWKLFSTLLDFVGHYPDITPGIMPSPYGICNKFFSKIVPTAQELILIRNKQIYLTWRNDQWWKGWHTPGAHIKPGESFKRTCQRIADNEVPGIKIKGAKILGVFSFPRGPRFHNVAIVTKAEFTGKPTKGKWFSKFPSNFVQKAYIPLLRHYLK